MVPSTLRTRRSTPDTGARRATDGIRGQRQAAFEQSRVHVRTRRERHGVVLGQGPLPQTGLPRQSHGRHVPRGAGAERADHPEGAVRGDARRHDGVAAARGGRPEVHRGRAPPLRPRDAARLGDDRRGDAHRRRTRHRDHARADARRFTMHPRGPRHARRHPRAHPALPDHDRGDQRRHSRGHSRVLPRGAPADARLRISQLAHQLATGFVRLPGSRHVRVRRAHLAPTPERRAVVAADAQHGRVCRHDTRRDALRVASIHAAGRAKAEPSGTFSPHRLVAPRRDRIAT